MFYGISFVLGIIEIVIPKTTSWNSPIGLLGISCSFGINAFKRIQTIIKTDTTDLVSDKYPVLGASSTIYPFGPFDLRSVYPVKIIIPTATINNKIL